MSDLSVATVRAERNMRKRAQAERDACMNELRERNEDLDHWRPKVDALVAALQEIEALDDGFDTEDAEHEFYRAREIAADALTEWGKP